MQTWTEHIWLAFHAGDLTRTWRDVLLTLHTYRGRGGLAYPAHDTVAGRVRCNERTVRRALAAAAELGLVAWCHRRIRTGWRSLRSSNAYRFLRPEPRPDAAGARAPRSEGPHVRQLRAGSVRALLRRTTGLQTRGGETVLAWGGKPLAPQPPRYSVQQQLELLAAAKPPDKAGDK